MSSPRERLIKCFKAVFPELNEQEIQMASTASVANWDSVAGITLLTVTEEEFKITVKPEDLEQLSSFELILDYLNSEKLVASNAAIS
jgi:acyl carrier protein